VISEIALLSIPDPNQVSVIASKSALRDCMKSATASVLFFTDLQFKVNRVMSLSSGMAFGILARF
jgi:hypothetical protein